MASRTTARIVVAANAKAKLVNCDPGTIVAEKSCDGLWILVVDAARMPFIARNTKLAWESGLPAVLTMDRSKQNENRDARAAAREPVPGRFPRPPVPALHGRDQPPGPGGDGPVRGCRHRRPTGLRPGGNVAVDALAGKYFWVNEIEGWTVSVMRSRPTDELVRIYGRGQEVPLGDLPFADMDRHRG